MYKSKRNDSDIASARRLMMHHDSNKNLLRRYYSLIKSTINKGLQLLKQWVKEPGGLPTYCFEYSPDC